MSLFEYIFITLYIKYNMVKVIYKGLSIINESKINILEYGYKLFKMKSNESIHNMSKGYGC